MQIHNIMVLIFITCAVINHLFFTVNVCYAFFPPLFYMAEAIRTTVVPISILIRTTVVPIRILIRTTGM